MDGVIDLMLYTNFYLNLPRKNFPLAICEYETLGEYTKLAELAMNL